ncbi:MAG: signal peptidase I [Tahibacter sp.]
MRTTLLRLLRENRGLMLFFGLMLVFRSSLADWNTVPTSSMQPTIVEGDRILVNKLAFDLNLPLTHVSLHHFGDPQRGDIIVFDSLAAKTRLVKRVIGVPGDVVELIDNRLVVNHVPAQYSENKLSNDGMSATESLLGITHRVRFKSGAPNAYASFGPIEVPEGHYLVLGDNRDNSADSRVIGLVPRAEIGGRAREVVISLDYDNYYLPRSKRVLHSLD